VRREGVGRKGARPEDPSVNATLGLVDPAGEPETPGPGEAGLAPTIAPCVAETVASAAAPAKANPIFNLMAAAVLDPIATAPANSISEGIVDAVADIGGLAPPVPAPRALLCPIPAMLVSNSFSENLHTN
jgi:hypothetical protein